MSDRSAMLAAISEALASGAKNKAALARVRLSVSRGATPTVAQLRVVNETRERVGLRRISVAVYDKKRTKRRWEKWKNEVNETHESLVASRPLSPPQRRTES